MENKRIIIIDDNVAIHEDYKAVLCFHAENEADDEMIDLEDQLFSDDNMSSDNKETYCALDYEVESAYQGKVGAEMIKKARDEGNPYSVAFVDMRMPPGWNGLETIKHFWQDDPDIQVIICTAYSDHSLEEIASQIKNPNGFLMLKKPFDKIEVAQLANSLSSKWDLNKQVQAALELNKKIITQLQQKTDDLEKADRYKSEFLTNMSHELRTPLHGILSLAQDLSSNIEGNLNDDDLESLKFIKESGDRLLSVINDILDLSKLKAGRSLIAVNEFTPSEFMENLNFQYVNACEEKSLELQVTKEDNLPDILVSDRQMLRQGARILILNAIKFTDSGSIKVSLSKADSTFAIHAPCEINKDGLLALSITDTGPGIPKEKSSDIFKSFQQADGSYSRKHEGAGLGLAIAKELSKVLEGDLSLVSEESKGTTFTLYFKEKLAKIPEETDTLPESSPEEPENITTPDEALADKTILYFDDNMKDLFSISNFLSANKTNVLKAPNEAKIIELLAINKNVDLIILATGVDELNLLLASETIKAELEKIPSIALIKETDEVNDELMGTRGINTCIKKPITQDSLISDIKKVLSSDSSLE